MHIGDRDRIRAHGNMLRGSVPGIRFDDALDQYVLERRYAGILRDDVTRSMDLIPPTREQGQGSDGQ